MVPVLDALKHLAGLGRGVLRLVAGRRWRRRLDTGALGTGTVVRLLGSMPRSPQDNAKLVHLVTELVKRHDAQAADGARVTADHPVPPQGPDVVFFSGCANEALLPATSSRLLDLLRAGGCQVRHAAGQGCCGALAAHTGRPGRAAAQRRRNRIALTDALGEGAVIVSEAAGCGLELQLYGGELGERVLDATVLLDSLELPTLAPLPLRVAVHDACHLRHGQGVVTEPRRLLQRIPGLQIVQPDEAEVCCGSGGAWGMRHAELSSEIGRRKARVLAETGADLVVTTNVGCLGQIQDGLAAEGLDLPILPLSDVLWVAMDLARRGR